MTLPVTIPNTFANATTSIPLANLDANFVAIYDAVNGIGNGAESLANVSITGGTVTNVAVSATTLNTSGQVVFNDAGADVDFRVEGDTDANLLFVDASTDRVGIGTNAPDSKLHVEDGTTTLTVKSTTAAATAFFNLTAGAGGFSRIAMGDASDNDAGQIRYVSSDNSMRLFTDNAERARITSDGEVLVGGTTSIGNTGLVIQRTDNDPNLFFFRNDTSIGSGNDLGMIRFYGNDTTSNTPTELAYIKAIASGAHAAGDNPTDLVFGTTPDGSGTVEEQMRLTDDGKLIVGGSSISASATGVIGIGTGGICLHKVAQLTDGATLDITIATSGVAYWSGILCVVNGNSSNGATRTTTNYSVIQNNQFSNFSATSLSTQNGASGASSFTVTYVATGIIRVTNTSGATTNCSVSFFGGGFNMT